jgi:hypothetical protein
MVENGLVIAHLLFFQGQGEKYYFLAYVPTKASDSETIPTNIVEFRQIHTLENLTRLTQDARNNLYQISL